MHRDESRAIGLERPIRVQGYDIDFAGMVSNIVYVRWLEDLRMAMLDEFCPLDALIERGVCPVLAHTQIDYKRPIRLLDTVVGRMWMTDVGAVRWSLSAEFICNGETAATASQNGAFACLKDGRPVRMPAPLASLWKAGR